MNHAVVIVMQFLQTKISKTRCARRVFFRIESEMACDSEQAAYAFKYNLRFFE